MYILICSDALAFDDSKVSAVEVASSRLTLGRWPLYLGTRNRKHITTGDICLIYLAGCSDWSQHIVAVCEVGRKRAARSFEEIDSNELLTSAPSQILELEKISFLEPISIRALHGKLSFLVSRKWGSAFQGGCRRLSGDDAAILESLIVKKSHMAHPMS